MKTKTCHMLETLGPGRLCSLWALTTSDPLNVVTGDYLTARYASYGLRRFDLIAVNANIDETPEHCWLRVTGVVDGHIAIERTSP